MFASPRVVCAEVPQMAFQISAAKSPAPVVLVLNDEDNLGTRAFRTRIDGVSVRDDDVRALSFGTTDFVRLFHQPAELGFDLENRPSMIIPFPNVS